MSALTKNYNRRKISFKNGKGSFLFSNNGKKYLDFIQGIAVNSLGHSNLHLIKAINKQSKKVWHVSNAFIIPEGERLAKRLTKKTFADSVIFQNSGAEATEAAIESMLKLNDQAAQIAIEAGATGATDITGFGLLGHLGRAARESNVDLEINVPDVPFLPDARSLAMDGNLPGGSKRNLEWVKEQIEVGLLLQTRSGVLQDN